MDESIKGCIPGLISQEQLLVGEDSPDIRTYSPLTLAFIGDAVFSLYIRTIVVGQGNMAPGRLHERCSELVKASAQSHMIHGIFDALTDEEKSVYRRGRNVQAGSRAKNATMSEYRHATGLEALFGHLYLTGQGERMTELVEKCLAYHEAEKEADVPSDTKASAP
ncbi:ribonuclease III [Lacrimispora sp. NSJ-141]|uniref:Mini-ribonuclease 3 n=1 Tax=Lientehia hominis TaxID=2897778 RepID=A0AAP2W7K4_9FIRM|nr:ribonuclease III domain-containing protein [Lientehia hominis]MCD2492538.1 ribonuclease III [Lientehia hominis]